MRGSPFTRAVIAFAVLLFLGWPLWRLTHVEAQPPAAETVSAAATLNDIRLQLTFTTAPTELAVLHLGKVVWSEPSPGPEIARTLHIPYPKEGVDLQFQMQFPDALAAMRIRLTDPDGTERAKTIWGRGAVDEVVTFP